MIEREAALKLLYQHISKDNLRKHMLAVEAVMKHLAVRLGEDVELWSLTGLLHDIDLETVTDRIDDHGLEGARILEGHLPEAALQAIRVHPGVLQCESRLDWALYSADPITGLITAAVLMRPSKSLNEMPLKSLKKRFKDKRFAAGANRDQIRTCGQLGIELPEFMELSLTAMREIHVELGF